MDFQHLNQLFLKPKSSTSLSKLMKKDKNKVRSKLKSAEVSRRNTNKNYGHTLNNNNYNSFGVNHTGSNNSEDPNDLVDELELIYPHSDFSLLRNACARNEVDFFKVNENNHTSHQSMFIDPNYLNLSQAQAYQLDYFNQLRDVVEKQKSYVQQHQQNYNHNGNGHHVTKNHKKPVNGTTSSTTILNGLGNNGTGTSIKTVAEALALVRKKQKNVPLPVEVNDGNYDSLGLEGSSDNLDLKSIILNEFNENGGDVRMISRKYGLNSRVVNKWVREYFGEISPGGLSLNSTTTTTIHGNGEIEEHFTKIEATATSPNDNDNECGSLDFSIQHSNGHVHEFQQKASRKNKRKSNVPVQINYTDDDENPLVDETY